MIRYEASSFGLNLMCKLRGSVVPKALCMSLPSVMIAVGLNFFWGTSTGERFSMFNPDEAHGASEFNLIWSGYTGVLGFLIVFRSNLAYSRFWEGAQCICKAQAVWLNAVSNLQAFCDRDKANTAAVKAFQQLLVKLMSMLMCESLRECAPNDNASFETICTTGISRESLIFLDATGDKPTLLLQWVQQLTIEADSRKIIKVAPPILSRVFQELSNGIVAMKQAQNIRDVPFPFPYSQLTSSLLLLHTCITPVLASFVIGDKVACGLSVFLVVQSLWCLQITAMQIDQPFGQDANDLPMEQCLQDFNRQLLLLVEPLAQQRPDFVAQESLGEIKTKRSSYALRSEQSLGGQKHLDQGVGSRGADFENGQKHFEVMAVGEESITESAPFDDMRAHSMTASERMQESASPLAFEEIVSQKAPVETLTHHPPELEPPDTAPNITTPLGRPGLGASTAKQGLFFTQSLPTHPSR